MQETIRASRLGQSPQAPLACATDHVACSGAPARRRPQSYRSGTIAIPNDISIPEQRICERLGPLLREHAVGASLGDLRTAGNLLDSFELFLPQVLREVQDEWQHESLDGIYPLYFRKTAEREAELLGSALFITDQTFTPIHFRLQLSPELDRIAWLDLRLGEHTENGCRRDPYTQSNVACLSLFVAEGPESIDWFYHVGYGERES